MRSQDNEFNSPGTTIYPLLGFAPSQINYFGTYKDFRADWIYNNNGIAENIAIESNPLWIIFFRKVSYQDYISMSYILRKCADISLSIGNRVVVNENYKFGAGVNVNIYKQHTPSLDIDLVTKINNLVIDKKSYLMNQYVTYKMSGDKAKASEMKIKLKDVTREIEAEKIKLIDEYKNKHWNSGYVNVGYAFIFDYFLANTYKEFRYKTNEHVVWLHTGHGIKNKVHFSELIRYHWYEKKIIAGINIRIGNNEKKHLYIEYLASYINNIDHHMNIGLVTDIKEKIFLNVGLNLSYGKKLDMFKPEVKINFNL